VSDVEVITRQGCTHCAAALEAVGRICADFPVTWSSTDVDGDDELRAEYGDRVPVILIAGREHGYWEVEEDRFRAALTRLTSS
jgi:glutaredoxin